MVSLWDFFRELTLAERANDQAFRKQLQDAGAEARVINIPTDIDLFPNLHGYASGEAFAQALGTASTEHHGHAGPAFVRWLILNEKEARERLEANLAFWDKKTAELLKTGANPQALRIASRLGSIAAAAALAADVLQFPWAAPDGIEAEHLGPAGKAMIWAFLDILKLWVGKHGSKVSTQVAEAMSQLRAFYAGAPPAAFPITSRDGTTEKDVPDQPETVRSPRLQDHERHEHRRRQARGRHARICRLPPRGSTPDHDLVGGHSTGRPRFTSGSEASGCQ